MSSNDKNIRYFKWLDLQTSRAFGLGMGRLLPDSVMLLTTIATETGLPTTTSFQYDEIHAILYALSEANHKSVRNIEENPEVRVQRGEEEFTGVAVASHDILDVVDLLEYRLDKHRDKMIAYLTRLGYTYPFSRMALEDAAQNLTMVSIQAMWG